MAFPIPIPLAPEPIRANEPALPAIWARLRPAQATMPSNENAVFLIRPVTMLVMLLEHQYLAEFRIAGIGLDSEEVHPIGDGSSLIVPPVPDLVELSAGTGRMIDQAPEPVHPEIEDLDADVVAAREAIS